MVSKQAIKPTSATTESEPTSSDSFTDVEAGRELDKLIAERVFGVKKVFRPRDVKGANEAVFWNEDYHFIPSGKPPRTHMIDAREVPYFSTNISSAWLVVEKMMGLGFRYVTRGNFQGNGLHWAGFDKQEWADHNPLYQSTLCDSLPLAICRSALKAVAEREETSAKH